MMEAAMPKTKRKWNVLVLARIDGRYPEIIEINVEARKRVTAEKQALRKAAMDNPGDGTFTIARTVER